MPRRLRVSQGSGRTGKGNSGGTENLSSARPYASSQYLSERSGPLKALSNGCKRNFFQTLYSKLGREALGGQGARKVQGGPGGFLGSGGLDKGGHETPNGFRGESDGQKKPKKG